MFHQQRTVDLSTESGHAAIVKTAVWRTEEDTRAFAMRLAAQPGLADAFITLDGDLGAGKTTLARHLLHALGVEGRIKSPTYAVVEPYETGAMNIWHFDFYRFTDPREWEEAGFRDIFAGPGLKLAEWPGRVATLPQADLAIHIESHADEARSATLSAHGELGVSLLAAV